MNLKRALMSLRRYGVKGAVDWLLRILLGDEFSRRIVRTAIIAEDYKPLPGVTLIGDLDERHGSLCKTLDDFRVAVMRSGIPCQVLDTSEESIPADFAVNRYTHIVGMMSLPKLGRLRGCRQFRIAFWEFESGFLNAYPYFCEGADVIAFSDFCHDAFRAQLPESVAVHKILYPFAFEAKNIPDRFRIRERFGIGERDFMVFFNFNFKSGYCRKNPEAIVRAFAAALGHRADARLVFKTQGAKAKPEMLARLNAVARESGIADRMILIDDFLSNDDIFGLTQACDVYISLHRGEGFGLGVAEAMSLGKPVVVSDYGSTREFCNSENALLVPCRLVRPLPEQMDFTDYRAVSLWGDPDVDVAAASLKRLYEDRDFSRRLGEKARQFIADYFSNENFSRSAGNFISAQ